MRQKLLLFQCGAAWNLSPDLKIDWGWKVKNKGRIKIGVNTYLRSTCRGSSDIFIDRNAELIIGNNTFINSGVRISCSKSISVGDHCLIGDECLLIDNNYHSVVPGGKVKKEPIVLGDNVWISSRVIVLPGVKIGNGTVVGAGSVVHVDLEPHCFYAGNPIRLVKRLEPFKQFR